MTTLHVDPFDLDTENPPRDQWQRPLLVPPGGGERVAYTRASTLSGYICDESGLSTWQRQKLARGLAIRDDLAAMIAALPPLHADQRDKRSLSAVEKREDKATSKQLNDIIGQAMEAGGQHWKANWGSAIHAFTEPGADPQYVPARMQDDVASFHAEMRRRNIEILATEVFVVNEQLMCAGSFDHLVRVPDWGVCVLDKKTGSVDGKGLAFSVQLAVYANSEVYDLDTDERRPLESFTGGERVNRKVGVVAHIPLLGARTDLIRVDLMRGLHAAKLATNVRTARSLKDLCTPWEA